MNKKILIAEDHAFVRWSVIDICKGQGISDLDEVQTCRELMEALHNNPYTHLILDITLADGDTLLLLKEIFAKYPTLRVLVSSAEPAHLYAHPLYHRFGFRYLSKSEQGPETMQLMIGFLNNTPSSEPIFKRRVKTPFSELSLREKQVLRWLVRDWSSEEISRKLKITKSTLRVQKANILKKTNKDNIRELKPLAIIYDI